MRLMGCTIEIQGQSFHTVDTPENIGPWIGRILDMTGAKPNGIPMTATVRFQ